MDASNTSNTSSAAENNKNIKSKPDNESDSASVLDSLTAIISPTLSPDISPMHSPLNSPRQSTINLSDMTSIGMCDAHDEDTSIDIPQDCIIREDLESTLKDIHDLHGKTVLLTGGSGYIGSILFAELERRLPKNVNIVSIDNCSNSKPANSNLAFRLMRDPRDVRCIMCFSIDITNYELLLRTMRKYHDKRPIELVIHLAAKKSVKESLDKPLEYYDTNVRGTLNLMKAMKELSISKMIFASSAAIYGNPISNSPVNESHPLNAISVYGKTKKVCEEILRDVCEHTDLDVIALRYFNPAGSHPSGPCGEDCVGDPSNLLPIVSQVAVNERDKVFVYGGDYPTPDGTPIRDYIHVFDLVEAHFNAIERLFGIGPRRNFNQTMRGFEPYNIGGGKGTSVLQVINTMESVTNAKIDYDIVDRRDGDAIRIVSDVTKARNVLGWSPVRSIEEICYSSFTFERYLHNK